LFKEKLIWFSTFSSEDFDIIFEEFDVTFRYLYRGIIDQVSRYDTDQEFIKELQDEFNKTLNLFQHIMPEDAE
ncbi:MAG: hypothetical protein ABF311_03085, partial [Polaribacter sp.]